MLSDSLDELDQDREPPLARLRSATRRLCAAVLGWTRRSVASRTRRIVITGLVFLALVVTGKLGFGWGLLAFSAVAALMIAAPVDETVYELDAAARGPDDGGNARDDGWRTVVDAIPEPAIALDAAGNVMHHNALVRDIFPNIRARRPFSHVSRNPELLEAIEGAAASREPAVVDLYERVPLERRISATVSRLSPSSSGAGRLPAVLVTFRDQTEPDRLTQMRADFIANASHELRTPLASLRGFVETLQGPARDDPAARERFLGIMASQAGRMTRLIDDLLSLSRVEMKVHLRPTGIVELNEVANYVAQTMEPLAEASKSAVRVHGTDGPARIRGDREEMVQVLQNLVHNALKYGRDGGHVDIRLTRENNHGRRRVAVAVVDDGPGIAPEHLPRLTERFYRANAATSREKGGTGLGLAIVKHIVNRHRGDLRITSRLGHGSTFAVLLDEM